MKGEMHRLTATVAIKFRWFKCRQETTFDVKIENCKLKNATVCDMIMLIWISVRFYGNTNLGRLRNELF